MKTYLLATALLLTAPGAALAQAMPGMAMDAAPADKANMRAMQTMQTDMPKQGSGDPDSDFVTMMKPHHQGAIDMARVELQFGKDPELRKMAREIVRSQGKEVDRLKRWEAAHPR